MTTAQDKTYGWLKSHIAGLPPGEGVFLTEAGIAAEAGVSRTPVREALLRLEAEGLLEILPKKGAYVSAISDAEVEATMQARLVVEQWAAAQLSDRVAGVLPRLRVLLEEQRSLLQADDPRAFIEADRAFHRTIVAAAGNDVLSTFYESLRDRQIRMGIRAVSSRADRAATAVDEHSAIIDALATADPGRAEDAIRSHLENTLAVLSARAQLTPTRWKRSRS